MRSLPLFLMLLCGASFAQSQPGSPASEQRTTDDAPLTPAEGRRILGQLHELRALRTEAEALRDYIGRDAEQDRRERENADRALELERRAAELERDKAATYEALYRTLAAKPGWGCKVWRVVSFGMARCD
jgi:hypothetical protein